MTIRPADMLIFAAVVREGGFTRAASALGVTKQSVSESVARLEADLGVRLLERTTRRVRPTEAGAAYYERCRVIGAQIDEANDEARQLQLAPVGRLRVTAPVLYARRLLAPVLAEFRQRYPRVRVELLLSDRRVDLVSEGFDLAIRVGELDDSSWTARRLDTGRVAIVASPALLARHGGAGANPLATLPTIGLRSHETWRWNGRPVRVEPDLVVNDLELACAVAVAGGGVARLSTLVCGDALGAGLLVPLPGADGDDFRPIYLVYPSRKHPPLRVRLFIDALLARRAGADGKLDPAG